MNAETGQHTNTVEGGLWQKFKQAHKQRYGTKRDLLNSYVEEFFGENVRRTRCFFIIFEHKSL